MSDGEATVGNDKKAPKENAVVLTHGDTIQASVGDEGYARFLVICGQPIGEPIVQHGPFVMNTKEEI